jgi:hypothetical protein
MKFRFLCIVSIAVTSVFYSCTQNKSKVANAVEQPKEINQIVEASCGQCQFKLKTQKGCDLAIRIDKKAYFVDGSDIDDHGDAHADEGFCNSISKAKVKGKIVDGRFKATEFKLLKD